MLAHVIVASLERHVLKRLISVQQIHVFGLAIVPRYQLSVHTVAHVHLDTLAPGAKLCLIHVHLIHVEIVVTVQDDLDNTLLIVSALKDSTEHCVRIK